MYRRWDGSFSHFGKLEMKIESIQISEIKKIKWQNKVVTTGIFKEPVDNPVLVRGNNIVGDKQADPTVHGGKYKAIYSYSLEHYDYLKKEINRSKHSSPSGSCCS